MSPPPTQNSSTRDLKQRVISCLNKLSDRDTYTIATTELESIAQTLNHDSFSPFLSCIYYTDPSQKSPVRKQCVRLLGFLSETHGDALSPFVPKMVSNIVRRLRDPDSTVRSACVDTVAIMAGQISKPSFSVFQKPLMEAMLLEQDQNSQSGSALCLARAIGASADPELGQLQRVLPKLMKLLKTESFKAKPALLALISSIVGVGGAGSYNVLVNLIPCVVEFLRSEDWASRRAATEALMRLAVVERDRLSEFKDSCLSTFEARKFDKIKAVRDTMNAMLEAWKEIPDASNEGSLPSQAKSYSQENASDGRFAPGSRNSVNKAYESPEARKKASPTNRSSPGDPSYATTARQKSPLKRSDLKSSPPMFRKLDRKKPTNSRGDTSNRALASREGRRDDRYEKREEVIEHLDNENDRCQKVETRHSLFNNSDDRMSNYAGLGSGSRVVPAHQESSGSAIVLSNATEELQAIQKTSNDLSLIRKQLGQIENQQASLFDLLQNFIGSSQNGMQSLETRVHGLEMALDEISYDLAISTGRMSKPEAAGSTCCRLPGAEFLSSKFWKKTEGRHSSVGAPSMDIIRNMPDRGPSAEPFNLENRRFRLQGGSGFVNPLANIHSEVRQNSEVDLIRMQRNAIQESNGKQVGSGTRPAVPLAIGNHQPK